MATLTTIAVADNGQTTDTTPLYRGGFGFPANAGGLLTFEVFAVRSDGASKGWTFQALVKRGSSGEATVAESIPGNLNVFASVGDSVLLASVTAEVDADEDQLRVKCTGQASQTIQWSVRISGRTLEL
jgi:hypothetical protein